MGAPHVQKKLEVYYYFFNFIKFFMNSMFSIHVILFFIIIIIYFFVYWKDKKIPIITLINLILVISQNDKKKWKIIWFNM
jgi:hypothetical protein